MPVSHLELPAPAKINLFLHVCGRRPDGYHNLQTVFQFLDICDRLTFDLRSDGKIRLHTAFSAIPEADNLITRAARALQQTSHTGFGADIHIDKRLPMGAGIGGGSSDAATTLVALNELWHLSLTKPALQAIGVRLGADVPIFIHGHSAWAEGIGEQLHDIEPEEKWHLLLFPPCHVPTAAIFSHPDLTRDSKMMKMSAFLEPGNAALFRNDCEPLVRVLYPEVDEAIRSLSGLSEARMTGTGACVFASFASRAAAEAASHKLPEKFRATVSKSCNQSPLHTALKSVNQVF